MADNDPAQNLPAGYVPPRVWTNDTANGGAFASINRPVSGATHEKVLPVGEHPLQLYSMGTPNGVKVTIMLEELLAAGSSDAEYDAWLIAIVVARSIRISLASPVWAISGWISTSHSTDTCFCVSSKSAKVSVKCR